MDTNSEQSQAQFPQLTGLDLRGDLYMKVFKERSPYLLLWADQIVKEKRGIIRISDVASLVPRIGLPVKTTFEFLEYAGLLESGTWDRLVDKGWTARKIREALKQREGNLHD